MDVLEAPELFKSYPQLENVRVLLDTWLPENVRGQYEAANNTIVVNKNLQFEQGKIRSVLHHEIQHVIQGIEGFARGGNTKTFAVNDEGMVNVGRQLSDMTPEERRASLASETEDVAREDQIVLEQMLGGAAASDAVIPSEARNLQQMAGDSSSLRSSE